MDTVSGSSGVLADQLMVKEPPEVAVGATVTLTAETKGRTRARKLALKSIV